jgi:uncharacterized protein YgfB (UPF0149 family)
MNEKEREEAVKELQNLAEEIYFFTENRDEFFVKISEIWEFVKFLESRR